MILSWLRRHLQVAFAVCALIGAVVVVLPEWLLPSFVVALASSPLASSSLVLVASGLVGLYGVRVLVSPDEEDTSRTAVRFPQTPPETAVHEVRRVVGEDVNGAASTAVPDEKWKQRRHRRRAYGTLRTAAVDAIVETTGCTRETATELVAEGKWTDKPRARAYLAQDTSIQPPLRTRVRDWAAGEQTERAVQDTVSAILSIRDGDADVARAELAAIESTASQSAAHDDAPAATTDEFTDAEPPYTPSEDEDTEKIAMERNAALAETDGGAPAESPTDTDAGDRR
ncbi:DUF7269 family protein [Halogeometricum borinquense]|uniref:DUF7269 family protein n=1 Tax=Halogeometricum borinquense TaxID=60847 RepID=UPI0034179615